jgi:hypothetical protein
LSNSHDQRSPQIRDRSRYPDSSKQDVASFGKTTSGTPERGHPAVAHDLPAKARANTSADAKTKVATTNIPQQKAKFFVVQYYDTNDYNQKMNDPTYLRNPVDMIDPGDYAIFIQVSHTQTFLYRPEKGSGGSYSIVSDDNTRPERKGHLIEGFLGEKDFRLRDVDAVRNVVKTTRMESGMSSCDWIVKVSQRCEREGLLMDKASP